MGAPRYKIYLLSFGFLACISWPVLNNWLGLASDINSFENRKPADKPAFDVAHLDPYPARYEAYYNDHFTIRSRFVRFYNLFKLISFGQSPIPDKIIIGNDGWLFSASQEFESFLGKNNLTTAELQAFGDELRYRKNYLARKNCRFYFLIVPGKASIYEEKIGFRYYRMNKQSWGEQLISYLEKNTDVDVINVYDCLRAAKTPEDSYHKLDNHWNDLGAFHTSNKVISVMQKDFPQLRQLELGDFTLRKKTIKGGNLQKMLGNLPMFEEIDVRLEPRKPYSAGEADRAGYVCPNGFAYPWEFEFVREQPDTTRPRLLVISDSFGEAIFPFLAENFSHSVKIFDAWEYKLNENIVENEKPDAVLLMINEPILRNLLSHQSRPEAN